jgi:hypothetical protein
MQLFRRRLAWVVSGWLCCQLSVLTAAPLSLFANASHAADPMSCTCIHTGNALCPMHHPATPKSNCQCRNTTDPDAATIVSLLGPLAVLATAPQHAAPLSITRSPDHQITGFVSIAAPPDGPPPRA